MGVSVLQTNFRDAGLASTSSAMTAPMQSNLTSGTRLVVAISFEISTVSAISVSDNVNGSWSFDADSGALAGSSGAGGGRIVFFSVANTLNASTSLTTTASWTTASQALYTFYEVSGGVTFDKVGTAVSGTGTLTALGFSITPANSNSFVLAVGISNSSTGIAADTGYTGATTNQTTGSPIGRAGNVDFHSHEYRASASGAQSLNFSGTGTGGASMFGVSYVIPGGAAQILMGQACL